MFALVEFISTFGGAALSKAAAYPPGVTTAGVDVEDVVLLVVVVVEAPSAMVGLVVLILLPTLSTMLSTATDGVAKAGKCDSSSIRSGGGGAAVTCCNGCCCCFLGDPGD